MNDNLRNIRVRFLKYIFLIFALILVNLVFLFANENISRKSRLLPPKFEKFELTFFKGEEAIALQITDFVGNILKEKGEIPDGEVIEATPGELKTIMIYENNRLNGVSKNYYPSGNLFEEDHYKNGFLEKRRQYYENGSLKTEGGYKYHLSDGVYKSYSKDGMLLDETNYKMGSKDGISKWYLESGDLRFIENYKNGNFDGIQKYYHLGNLYEERLYKDGKLISITKEP